MFAVLNFILFWVLTFLMQFLWDFAFVSKGMCPSSVFRMCVLLKTGFSVQREFLNTCFNYCFFTRVINPQGFLKIIFISTFQTMVFLDSESSLQ